MTLSRRFSYFAVFVFLSAVSYGQINLSGNVHDGNQGPLVAGQVYLIQSTITVPTNEVLTIQAGAVVKIGVGPVGIHALGQIFAQGTAPNPIIITSLADDSVGGDSNGDGLSAGSPGDWGNILMRVGANDSVFSHVRMRFGGRSGSTGMLQSLSSRFDVNDCVFTDSAASAVHLGNEEVTLQDCRFEDCQRALSGVVVDALDGFNGNVALNNVEGDQLALSSLVLSQNLNLSADNLLADDVLICPGNLPRILPTASLTIDAGLILKFPMNSTIDAQGPIIANGSATDPVTFTTLLDDARGGDSNRDGPSSGSPGDWSGILFRASAQASQLKHCHFLFARTPVLLQNSDILIEDCLLADASVEGLRLGNSNPVVQRCSFEDCAVSIQGLRLAALVNFSDNSAVGNADGDSIRISGGFPSSTAISVGIEQLFANQVLVVTSSMTIPTTSSLELPPGAIVKMPLNTVIDAQGTLLSVGTETEPIIFTSQADDSAGGDSLNDGPTQGAPGDWSSLVLRATASQSRIEHCEFRFLGSGSGALVLTVGAPFEMFDTLIVDAAGPALRFSGSAGARVERCTFRRCERPAAGLRLEDLEFLNDNRAQSCVVTDSLETVDGNVSSVEAIRILRRQLTDDVLVLRPSIFRVQSGGRLDVEPGVILKAASASLLLDVFGELNLNGEGCAPVVFTSIDDDEFGGDTMKDGSATLPQAGSWDRFLIRNAATGAFRHALLRYGGRVNSGVIDGGSSAVSFESVRVEFAADRGFDLNVGSPIRNCIAYACAGDGFRLDGGGTDLEFCSSVDNAGVGFRSLASHNGTLSSCIAQGNLGGNYDGYPVTSLSFCNGDAAAAGSGGNIDADARFEDQAAGDLRLAFDSPCLDAGDQLLAATLLADIDDAPRLTDSQLDGSAAADMGAHERHPYSLSVSGTQRIGRTLVFRASGPEGGAAYFAGTLDGTLVADPFGVILIGKSSTIAFLGIQPIGSGLGKLIPNNPSLVGLRFGIQALAVSNDAPSTGVFTNACFVELSAP